MFGNSILNDSFSNSMNEKVNRYNALITRAERTNAENQGVPTKAEAELYVAAMDLCEEIMNMNQSQRNTYAKWQRLKEDCGSEIRRILAVLDPKPPVRQTAPAPVPAPTPTVSAPAAAPKAPRSKPVESKTDSGFTTKNASNEVPAAMIESWYKEMPKTSFDDMVGSEKLRENLEKEVEIRKYKKTQDRLGLQKMRSFIFYGPPGTGKTTVIKAFVHELMEDENYKFLQLSGGEIKDSLVGRAEKKVDALFKEAVDNEPCIIFVDELENVCANRKKQGVANYQESLTVAFLEGYNHLIDSGKTVIFIGATNLLENIDSAMLDRMYLVEVGLPNAEVRESFFEKNLDGVRLEDGLTTQELAKETENYSFRNLQELTDDVLMEFGHQTIMENLHTSFDGREDVEATDAATDKAIEEGRAVLTRELFDRIRAKHQVKAQLNARFEKKGL